MKHHYYHLLLFALSLLLWNCAQVAPLTGGPRDTNPPKLTGSVPENASSEFSGDIITLTFNEYVQVKDLQNQLIVTPSLKTEPEISAEGKKIKIKLQAGELLPNTTYRIFFGRSIVDMTEGNANDGFQFVFSTGKYIDSLKIAGNISDALTTNAVKDALIVLYPSGAKDSSVFNSQPLYVARSNASGEFEMNYLPRGSFRIFGILDKNKNYRYDGEEEQIAFNNTPVSTGNDSSVSLTMFPDAGARFFLKKTYSPQNGLLHIIYNRKGFFDVSSLTRGINYSEKNPGREKDTVSIYYFSKGYDSLIFKIKEISGKSEDTIRIMIPKINPSRKKSLSLVSNIQSGVLPVNQPVVLAFSSMPDTAATKIAKLKVYERRDSGLVQLRHRVVYDLPAAAKLIADVKPGVNYLVKIDTAAFYDFNGRYNDSAVFIFKTQTKEELGKLTINLKVAKKQLYVIQLLTEQEKVLKEFYKRYALNSSSSESIDFTDVPPGSYRIRIVFDDNENRKWDSGDLMKKIQPEKIFIHSKAVKVLPDWELEEEVKVN